MPNVDQFESVFKSASKVVYRPAPPRIETVAVVTDLSPSAAGDLAAQVKHFLRALGGDGTGDDGDSDTEWQGIDGSRTETVEQLLGLVEAGRPDLVVTYRNLHSAAWQWPHSLGRHLDVLTQATECPVLVIPHPSDRDVFEAAMGEAREIMALTDHLTGDGRLVDYAVAMAGPDATIFLAHVEDEATFERYMGVVERIAEINSDIARTAILGRLLKEPRDYIESCAAALAEVRPSLRVEIIVKTGHRLSECRDLIEAHGVDLLLMNTKDADQLAMHGLSYPLAVELRGTPILML